MNTFEQGSILILGIIVSAAGGAVASWGAVKGSLGSLTAEMAALRNWLESVAKGETEHMGRMNEKVANCERIYAEHGERITKLEYDCKRRLSGRGAGKTSS